MQQEPTDVNTEAPSSIPILESLADEFAGQATFLRVDADVSRDLVERFEVSAVPTVLILAEGREVERFSGVPREQALRDSLRQAGASEDVAIRLSNDKHLTAVVEK